LNTQLTPVPSIDAEKVWPFVAELVTDALDHGSSRVSPNDVREGVGTGRYQLWVAWRGDAQAIAVTEIIETATTKLASIFICVGNQMEDWLGHLETIEDWARSEGCSLIANLARWGWQRPLKKLGYKATHVMLEKKL
tara:strand:- start:570 stop:980 length:411 start_codon:yes stop_codon:yes gene_type:complete